MCPQWRQSCSPPLTLPWPSTQAPGGNTAPNATSHGHPPSPVHVPAQLSLSSVHQPRAQPCTHLLPFRLPSSESALEEPLFLESQDFTPSTRSSSSESTSESPSLPEERVRVEESKRSARGSEVLGTGEMEVQWKALNPSSTHCLRILAWVKPHPVVPLYLRDIICMHIVQPATQGLPEAPPNHPCTTQRALAPSAQHLPVTARLQSWRQQGLASGQQAGHSSRNTGEISSSGIGKEISGLIL